MAAAFFDEPSGGDESLQAIALNAQDINVTRIVWSPPVCLDNRLAPLAGGER
jgi:hypothetical protein